MRSRGKKLAVALAALLVVVALAVVIPTVLVADPSSPQTKADPPVTAVDATTSGLLSVFDRPRTASDELPQPAAGADPGALSDRTAGESYDLSRRATPEPGADPVYLWPRKDGACFSTKGVSSCADASDIAQHGAIVTYSGGQQIGEGVTRVAGIARDGVRAIEVTLADGTTATAPVVDNAFSIDVSSPPQETRWVTPDGTAHDDQAPTARMQAGTARPSQ